MFVLAPIELQNGGEHGGASDSVYFIMEKSCCQLLTFRYHLVHNYLVSGNMHLISVLSLRVFELFQIPFAFMVL